MRVFSVKLEGLQTQLRRLRQDVPKQIKAEIAAELEDGVNRMVQGAKQDAPGDQGILRGEISSFKVGELTVSYVSAARYSGYLEFGTRSKVVIPAGLEAYAAEVKAQKNISSLTAKEAIYQWCKRQGIDEDAWYAIYISIMVKGIAPRPFFFKQIDRQLPSIIKNIQNILNSLD